jgi:glycosyltransferase involved in cell wall biosynthesis
MLRGNGVHDFVAAAGLLRDAGVGARFVLIGAPDPDDPASVPFAQLRAWHIANVEWWEWLTDMTLIWRDVHIACLPSRRRDAPAFLPASLLEAAACGLPIVATDTAGAREVVTNGDNGLLVPVGDVPALAKALRILIDDAGLRGRMGQRSRALAERMFSSGQISGETLAVYQSLVPPAAGVIARGARAGFPEA